MSLIGIYSYPKSGNTWIRGIVASLMNASGTVVPDLHERPLSDAQEYSGFRFFKHHGPRNIKYWRGQEVNATRIIHIRRNPLDVFASYLNFISANVTNTASIPFASVEAIMGTDLLDLYFKSFIVTGHIDPEFSIDTGDYFSHNKYWIEYSETPIARIRYEVLLHNPLEALSFLRDWLGISDDEILRILDLAGQATKKDGKFYWRQEEKNYLNFLQPEQIELFLKYRGEDCRKLGYDPEYLRSPRET